MSTLAEIETAVLKLEPTDFQRFAEWFRELDQQLWDKELEQDIKDGKLERFAQEAIEDFRAGRYRKV